MFGLVDELITIYPQKTLGKHGYPQNKLKLCTKDKKKYSMVKIK